MRIVDASVVVAALVTSGPIGDWAEGQLRSGRLAAPHLMPVEVAGVLRRSERAGDLLRHTAQLAHRDLLDMPVDLFPYEPFAERIWQLRATVTTYDAWYVALAESLDATLSSLDRRLAAAPGPTCRFVTPPL